MGEWDLGKIIDRDAILGLPIIYGPTGKRMGTVEGVRHRPHAENVEGIILSRMGIKTKYYFLGFNRINSFGESSIIIDEDLMEEIKGLAEDNTLGKTIILKDGRELGIISDIIFDSGDGRIEGFEISKGFMDDLIGGRSMLLGKPSWALNQDNYIIPDEADIEIKSGNGGILNILSKLKE